MYYLFFLHYLQNRVEILQSQQLDLVQTFKIMAFVAAEDGATCTDPNQVIYADDVQWFLMHRTHL